MKTLVTILIIASFLQTAILPLDLVLIILICRAYLRADRANVILSFFFGILISLLEVKTLGLQSVIYLVLTEATAGLSKSRLAGHPLLIIPLVFILVSVNHLINSIASQQSLQLFPKVILEALLALPILYMMRLWEERFVIQKEIKLKV